jgi:hypothetical protein
MGDATMNWNDGLVDPTPLLPVYDPAELGWLTVDETPAWMYRRRHWQPDDQPGQVLLPPE